MMPGTTNLPVTSITVVPAGAATPVPMSRSRPFSITIVTWLCGAVPVRSISVAPRNTVTGAAALLTQSAVAMKTANAEMRIVAPMLMSAMRGMSINGFVAYLSLAHHGRRQMLDRRRAHLLGHRARFSPEDFEHTLDAGLAERAKAPEIRPAHADGPGTHAQRFDHVGAASKAGVDQHWHRAGDLHDLRQRLDRRPSTVLTAVA